MKITFIGAGSTVFSKKVLGDVLLTDALRECEIALYDIDGERVEESYIVIDSLNKKYNNGKATIKKYVGVENRKEAFRNSDFLLNAIQVGGYEPCTVIDFEIPKKYGIQQTIADTLGIGGIFRALRTIKVLDEMCADMREVCPDAWLINYTNPMAMITGYLQRYSGIKTIGLCHSVQVCSESLLSTLGIKDKYEVGSELIAGINHMAWLLEIKDKQGNDLYPEIRKLAKELNATTKHGNMVRLDYIDKFGYYCTESSEHNAEYSALYIKPNRPDLIEKFQIPLDEYLRRCVSQIENWKKQKDQILNNGDIMHEQSNEYAAKIINAIVTNVPYKFGGNVINNGLIPNLPANACVEVPCYADSNGIHPSYVGNLPTQLMAMNTIDVLPQLLTIEAAHEKSVEKLYQAAMLEPHTASVLSTDEIIAMCDEMLKAHADAGFPHF